MRKPQPLLAFQPQFPVYLLGRNGRPLVSMHADGKAAIGYSSRELAREAGELLLQEGATQIGVLSVSTADRFQQVIAQLARHDVRYLLWDHVGEEAGSRVIDLKTPE